MKGYLVWYNGDNDECDFVCTEYFSDAKMFLNDKKAQDYCTMKNNEEMDRIRKRGDYPERCNYYLWSSFEVIE